MQSNTVESVTISENRTVSLAVALKWTSNSHYFKGDSSANDKGRWIIISLFEYYDVENRGEVDEVIR